MASTSSSPSPGTAGTSDASSSHPSPSSSDGLHISRRRIRSELIWLGGCLAAGIAFNVYAILLYDASWSELLTQAHVAGLLGVAFYLVGGAVRLVTAFVRRALSAGSSR